MDDTRRQVMRTLVSYDWETRRDRDNLGRTCQEIRELLEPGKLAQLEDRIARTLHHNIVHLAIDATGVFLEYERRRGGPKMRLPQKLYRYINRCELLVPTEAGICADAKLVALVRQRFLEYCKGLPENEAPKNVEEEKKLHPAFYQWLHDGDMPKRAAHTAGVIRSFEALVRGLNPYVRHKIDIAFQARRDLDGKSVGHDPIMVQMLGTVVRDVPRFLHGDVSIING